MLKYSFKNDYSEMAHPAILKALADVGEVQFEGYGLDAYSMRAISLIRDEIGRDDAEIHFISGGTPANLVVLSSLLRPHEAVIAADTGHITTHETGAIEATGHKICQIETTDGKITLDRIAEVVKNHGDEHMVKPRVVFISFSTEIGTLYSRQELADLALCCRKNHLLLYVDGARLGAGLYSSYSDVTIGDIAHYADCFYIGGTKNGALFGEAIVLLNPHIKQDFRYILKQKGGLLAKGAVLGRQFETFFTPFHCGKTGAGSEIPISGSQMSDSKSDRSDSNCGMPKPKHLYEELASHAFIMAMRLRDGIRALGYSFLSDAVTNQIFPIFPEEVVLKLERHYSFHRWMQMENNDIVLRLVTSWATPEAKVDEFLENLKFFTIRN